MCSGHHSSSLSLAMDPLMPVALQYIREVQSTIAGRTYDQFRQTLRQYGHRIIDSSTVISTVHKLFHDHQTLLDSFRPFVPTHRAASPEDLKVRCCLDFLHRVRARFHGGRSYGKFLDCMHAYARAEITAYDVRHMAQSFFGEADDLFHEFMCFLPRPERSERRTTDRDLDGGFKVGMKRRGSGSGSGSDEETPRRTVRRRLHRYGREEEAAARRVINRHNEMEDLMCEIDVKIGNLKTCIKKAEELHGDISGGRLYAAEVRLGPDEHFTPLNLACIRMFYRKFLEVTDDEDMARALSELKRVLLKKREGLERERLKIAQRWNRICH